MEYMYRRRIAVDTYKFVKGKEGRKLEGMYITICSKRRNWR